MDEQQAHDVILCLSILTVVVVFAVILLFIICAWLKQIHDKLK